MDSEIERKDGAVMTRQPDNNADRILILDTTLRDGEQPPSASMSSEEKLDSAEALERMGVDIIEAGFPIAPNGDFEALPEVTKLLKEISVCGLALSSRADIDSAADALLPVRRQRDHAFISSSPVRRKHKLQMSAEAVLDAVIAGVSHARNLCDDVEWPVGDATRREPDSFCRYVEAAIKAGAREGEWPIDGIGGRAGNAAIEEIVMVLRTRGDRLPGNTGIRSERILRVSKLLSAVTSFSIQYNKAVVGKNAFAHKSGIHQGSTSGSTEATGDGLVDVIFNAIRALLPHRATLWLYQVHAVTEGTDVQAEVSARLEEDGWTAIRQVRTPISWPRRPRPTSTRPTSHSRNVWERGRGS